MRRLGPAAARAGPGTITALSLVFGLVRVAAATSIAPDLTGCVNTNPVRLTRAHASAMIDRWIDSGA